MLQHFLFILVQLQRFQNHGVSFHQLAGGEADRQTGLIRMVMDQMDDGVETSVHRAVVVAFVTEILSPGFFLIGSNVNGVLDQLTDTLILCSRNGNHRHTQQVLQRIDVNVSAVLLDLVHHVQRNHHGRVHLQQLHGQIEVPLNVSGIHDVDDGGGSLHQHKVAGDDFLTAVGRHGVNTGQVRHHRIGIAFDHTVLTVHRHAWEVAHVLVGTSQLVKQRGLAAILVAHQRKGHPASLRQGGAVLRTMELALFTEARMFLLLHGASHFCRTGRSTDGINVDLLRIRQPDRQFISVELQLHGVAHGCQFHYGDFCPRNDAHVQKMLAQRSISAHHGNNGRFSDFQIFECHTVSPCIFTFMDNRITQHSSECQHQNQRNSGPFATAFPAPTQKDPECFGSFSKALRTDSYYQIIFVVHFVQSQTSLTTSL